MDSDSFISAMRDDLANLVPRLAFAAWLDETGQEEKASYLRLQCEQSKLLNRDPRYFELSEKMRALAGTVARSEGWSWFDQVSSPRFPLFDQILKWHLDRLDPSYTVFAVVVRETTHFAEIAEISGKDIPILPPVVSNFLGRFKKHWFDSGGVLVGDRWFLWPGMSQDKHNLMKRIHSK